MKATAVLAIVLAVLATSVSAQPRPFTIFGANDFVLDQGVKNCSDVQWQCLTSRACVGVIWNGIELSEVDLRTYDCPDLPDRTRPGLCVLVNATGFNIDTQEQGCKECYEQCLYWADCAGVVFNYVEYEKGVNFCGSPSLPSPAIPAPNPSPTVTVVPSPAVPAPKPSPAVPVPSPAVPVPSPAVPVPSPKVQPSPAKPTPSPFPLPSPRTEIIIVPGQCNLTSFLPAAPTVVTSLFTYITPLALGSSDECCTACAVSPTCNMLSYCIDETGCEVPGLPCVNGPPHNPPTTLGPNAIAQPWAGIAAACLPGGLYPRFTCMLQQYTATPDPLAVPALTQPFGWLAAIMDPRVQPNFDTLNNPDYPIPNV